MIALIGAASDIRHSLGQLAQKIAIVTYDDALACVESFKLQATNAKPPAELILLDATQASVDVGQFLQAFRDVRGFEKIPVIVMMPAADAENSDRPFQPDPMDPSSRQGTILYLPKSSLKGAYSPLSQIITDYWMTA
uniref:hypothetical protein n=1 Tax=Pararhizobium sp. IMCC3301 TaxID=3067904 RepID=UPI002740EA11|nr:hypothetical protein [Pararhizobium sp. IMCC3301]